MCVAVLYRAVRAPGMPRWLPWSRRIAAVNNTNGAEANQRYARRCLAQIVASRLSSGATLPLRVCLRAPGMVA